MRPTESMPVSVPTPAEGFDLLLEAGRAAVYRRNAFRITQLAVDATPREITRQTEKLRLLEKLGGGARAAGGLGLDPPPDQDAVREALQRLRDPERRLVDELFWFWPQALGQATSDPALQALERGDVAGAARQWLTRERDGSEHPGGDQLRHDMRGGVRQRDSRSAGRESGSRLALRRLEW